MYTPPQYSNWRCSSSGWCEETHLSWGYRLQIRLIPICQRCVYKDPFMAFRVAFKSFIGNMIVITEPLEDCENNPFPFEKIVKACLT